MSKFNVGDRYYPIGTVIAIPGKQNRWGIVTNVEEFPDCTFVEADYGVVRGNPRHIFIDTVPKETFNKQPNMDTTNTIQFIEFPVSRYGGTRRKITSNEAVIYRRSKDRKSNGATFQIRLPPICKEAIDSGYDKIRVAVNNLTNETFLVLDTTEGITVSKKKSDTEGKNNRLVNRPFVEWLETRFGLPKDGGGVIVFSDNLSRNGGYTYRIEPKKD